MNRIIAVLGVFCLVSLAPLESLAGACKSAGVLNSPAWKAFKQLVEEEYLTGYRKRRGQLPSTYADNHAANTAVIYGHALGRLYNAAASDKERLDLADCLQEGVDAWLVAHTVDPTLAVQVISIAKDAKLGASDQLVAILTGVTSNAPLNGYFVNVLGTRRAGGANSGKTLVKSQPGQPRSGGAGAGNNAAPLIQAAGSASGSGTCNWMTITMQSESPAATCARFKADGWITRVTATDCKICDPDDLKGGNGGDGNAGGGNVGGGNPDPQQGGNNDPVAARTPANAVCRDLRQGDKWYPSYVRCCDIGGNRSRWWSKAGSESEHQGSCQSWGISGNGGTGATGAPQTRTGSTVCRALRQGDKWYPSYVHCCDIGGNRSRWTSKSGSVSEHQGNCRSWEIN